ncbi:MAG TPA: hypothetical protein VEL31_21030 [Ktedonobacteraceae bacterium]|nr:hypothetical protein [Ktedonobacteraceae bacterium]
MAEHLLRLRKVAAEELLPEERVVQKDPDNPFLGPGDRPEPYRSYFIAYARLEPVFKKENIQSPLIVQTPRGQGLVWRWWSERMGVVLMKRSGNEWVLEEHVTFLEPEERENVTLDLTQIVLNPPKWG